MDNLYPKFNIHKYLLYGYVLGWDHFVSAKIKMWEEFHLKWLQEGNDVMVIIFEHLTDKSLLDQTLKDISLFLNFELDENRLECTIKHSEGRFHRKGKCIGRKKALPVKTKKVANEDNTIFSSALPNNTNDIFTSKQKQEINLAIRNVNEAIINRDLTQLPLSDYENTVIRLNLCP